MPVSIAARLGEHVGAAQKACRKTTASRAKRARLGAGTGWP